MSKRGRTVPLEAYVSECTWKESCKTPKANATDQHAQRSLQKWRLGWIQENLKDRKAACSFRIPQGSWSIAEDRGGLIWFGHLQIFPVAVGNVFGIVRRVSFIKRGRTYVWHKLFADWADFLGKSGRKHHDLLMMRSCSKDILHILAHICILNFRWLV